MTRIIENIDPACVARARSGCERSTLALFEHFHMLLGIQARKLSTSLHHGSIEDAWQDVRMLALELLREWDANKNPQFDAYFVTMLKWRVHNRGRFMRRIQPLELMRVNVEARDDLAHGGDGTSFALLRKFFHDWETLRDPDALAAVERAALKLTNKERERLYKRYIEDKTSMEIAREEGVTLAAINNTLRRAERRLRREVQEHVGSLSA